MKQKQPVYFPTAQDMRRSISGLTLLGVVFAGFVAGATVPLREAQVPQGASHQLSSLRKAILEQRIDCTLEDSAKDHNLCPSLAIRSGNTVFRQAVKIQIPPESTEKRAR